MKMKLCRRCDKRKAVVKFAKRGKSGRQSWCNTCKRRYNEEYYEAHRESYAKTKKERRIELRAKLRDFKKDLKCTGCKEAHTACLEFHHRDPATKDFSIGVAIGKLWSWQRIFSEIAKCDVLCSNCHRKLHWNEDHSDPPADLGK